MPTLREVVDSFDGWFPPHLADTWDAVGLGCGDLSAPVSRILLAIDVVPDVVAEAERVGAQLLFTHHPLLLTAVHAVAAHDPKGGLIHRMIRSSIAHFVAHTNAEAARPGVSDALADTLGLMDVEPIETVSAPLVDEVTKLVVFVPVGSSAQLLDELAAAGAGAIGAYDRCAWTSTGTGTFRPLAGANPAVGSVGRIESLDEARLEMVVPRHRLGHVLAALRANHPYEEPAFDVLARVPQPTTQGVGRVGVLAAPTRLDNLADTVARRLPATVGGVRAAGRPDQLVRRVAVLAGSGSSLADQARSRGADAYVTADLKHHNALEGVTQRAGSSMALIDVAHWASERPWLDVLAARLRARFGATVEVTVSDLPTDPWTIHVPAPAPG